MSAGARGGASPGGGLPKTSEAWHLLVALADKGIHVRCRGGRLLVDGTLYQRLTAGEKQELQRLRGELVALLEPATEGFAPERREAPPEEPFGLSASQRRMWNIEKVLGFGAPRLKAALVLRGQVDAAALERSFGRLLERHSALRTCVREHGGEVLQTFRAGGGFRLERFDVSGLSAGERWPACERIRTDFLAAPLTLETGEVFRAGLIRVEAGVSCLLVVMHHLCADASSMQVIYRDLVELYRQEVSPGTDARRELPPAHQYFEFVEWERRQAGAEVMKRLKEDWASAVNVHYGWRELRDTAASAEPRVPARRTSVEVPPARTARLRQLARECAATLNAVLLALTAKLADQHFQPVDARAERGVNIGMPVTGRRVPEFEDTVGFFANTVILSLGMGSEGALETLVRSCQERLMRALLHQGLPFQELFKAVAAPEGNRVYQISFNMMPRARPQEPLPGLTVDEWRTDDVWPGFFDLRIDVVEQDEALVVHFTHLLAKLSEPYVDALTRDFARLVDLACDKGAT